MKKTQTNNNTDPAAFFMKVDELLPYAKNARLHNDEQVGKLVDSLKEFGFTNPVLVDENNVIIAGHGRILAAGKLRLDEVPVRRLSHLNENQKKAYRLADNRLAEIGGGWDQVLLSAEVVDLKTENYDLSVLGFDSTYLNSLLNVGDVVENPQGEWVGMPEFEQENQGPHRQIVIKFSSPEHVQDFADLIRQTITENTQYLWFPKQYQDQNNSEMVYEVEE
jgi:hypothetical protein